MERLFDPDHPLLAAFTGLFHRQKIGCRQYSLYIPLSQEQDVAVVLVAIPNGLNAQNFADGDIGTKWRLLADETGTTIVFAEAKSGGQWEVQTVAGIKEEIAFLKSLVEVLRYPSKSLEAPFNMDERSFYMVGYQEGGCVLTAFAMQWPMLVCGLITVEGNYLSEEAILQIGEESSYPFAQAGNNLNGREENNLLNRDIPVPVWVIKSEQDEMNSLLVEQHWLRANRAKQLTHSVNGTFEYENPINPAERVWITPPHMADVMPAVLYHDFLNKIKRFPGDPGGRLTLAFDIINNGKTGFFITEEKIEGKLRRWVTYVPACYYTQTKHVPLILMLHGYTSSWSAAAGDSEWHRLADKIGCIVVYPQSYVHEIPLEFLNVIRTTAWNSYAYGLPDINDVEFLSQLVLFTKKHYRIDSSRVYLAGHSNGGQMAFRMAGDAPEQFAAIASIGSTIGGYDNSLTDVAENPVPIWLIKTQFDGSGADCFDNPDSYNVKTIKQWIQRNGCDGSGTLYGQKLQNSTTHYEEHGRIETTHWTNGTSPAVLLKYTSVKNMPHAYSPEMSEWIWNCFFSHYVLNEDGTRSCDGIRIESNEGEKLPI